MAAATYLMRVGGFWLMGHVPLTARMRKMLEALPRGGRRRHRAAGHGEAERRRFSR